MAYFRLVGNRNKHLGLDGLRAIAIIMVLLRHYVYFLEQKQLTLNFPSWLFNFMMNGWIGVELFFVLSGYLITVSLFNLDPLKGVKIFYFKRLLRTIPLYIVIIGIVSVNLFPLYSDDLLVGSIDYFVHSVFMQDYFGAFILVTLWSLATEEKFYILSPILAMASAKLSRRALSLILFILVLIIFCIKLYFLMHESELNYTEYFWGYRAPFHFAVMSIIIGAFVACADINKWNLNEQLTKRLKLLILTSIIIFLSFVEINSLSLILNHVTTTILTCAFGALLLLSLKQSSGILSAVLTSDTMQKLSKISYALYLCHLILLPVSYDLAYEQIGFNDTGILGMTTFFALYILLSVIMSLALHYIFEKPFLMLKNKL